VITNGKHGVVSIEEEVNAGILPELTKKRVKLTEPRPNSAGPAKFPAKEEGKPAT